MLKNSNAMTLVEVLVAAGIFAVVMTMAVGTFFSTSTFREKIKQTRDTGEEVRKIADMVTRDAREAKGGIEVEVTTGAVTKKFKQGFIAAECSGASECVLKYNSNPLEGINNVFCAAPQGVSDGGFILFSPDSYVIYAAKGSAAGGKIFYKKFNASLKDALIAKGGKITDLINKVRNDLANALTASDNEGYFYVAGYAPDETALNKQQAFVSFYINSRTLNYASLLPNERSESNICSEVALRNYK